MSLRFHEIAETRHQILNPFVDAQLNLLGDICELHSELRLLDLCCGKGEMLCRWSARYGLHGIGVDISKVFLRAARNRAGEMGCDDRLSFVEADAGAYPIDAAAFDIVSCIGATWIGGGLTGTLQRMRPGLRGRNSLILVGEPFWISPPSDEACAALAGGQRDMFVSLAETEARIAASGLELVEMVLANQDSWDRYYAKQWLTLSDWLRAHPDDPEAADIRAQHERARRDYLRYSRDMLGWGVFVARPAG
jgi:SAM-dependent methyltransferase